jgi:hypothetical protein
MSATYKPSGVNTVYINTDLIEGSLMSIVRSPLEIAVSVISNPDSLTVNLKPADPGERPLSFTFPNSELATAANHLLALVQSPAKARSLTVKATGPAQYFDAFWGLYPSGPPGSPRKVAKGQMLAKWQSQNLDKEWPAIQSDLQSCIPGWAKDRFKYCPLVTTYINQRRWETAAENQQPEIPMV